MTKALNVVMHPSQMSLPSLAAGLGAILLLAVLSRTRLSSVASLVALLVPTVIVIVSGVAGVATVSDLGPIPQGLPLPQLPSLAALSPTVITGALAVAAIVVVQGAGVAEAAPNPDGTPVQVPGATSEPKAWPTLPQGCSAANRWAGRSVRPL